MPRVMPAMDNMRQAPQSAATKMKSSLKDPALIQIIDRIPGEESRSGSSLFGFGAGFERRKRCQPHIGFHKYALRTFRRH
jgi:hypothetical protein